ncbi:MAG: ATP-binding protein, partial [Pseudomonadota bacterium]
SAANSRPKSKPRRGPSRPASADAKERFVKLRLLYAGLGRIVAGRWLKTWAMAAGQRVRALFRAISLPAFVVIGRTIPTSPSTKSKSRPGALARMPILMRVVFLSVVLMATLAGSHLYLNEMYWGGAEGATQQEEFVEALGAVNEAIVAFGKIARSLDSFVRTGRGSAMRRAETARRVLVLQLGDVKPHASKDVDRTLRDVRTLFALADKRAAAVRRRGLHAMDLLPMVRRARAIDRRLARLGRKLATEIVARNTVRIRRSNDVFTVSIVLLAMAGTFGLLATGFALLAIRRGLAERDRQAAQREEAELALSQSDARLNSIIENSPTVIYLLDAKGRYVHVNRQFEELYGLTKAKVVGKTPANVFPARRARSATAHIKNVVKKRTAIEREIAIPHADGNRNLATVKFPILDNSGDLIAIGGIEHDVTALKRAGHAALAAKEEAELANRAKSEFLANMSHELRTPLNAVIGFSSAMLEGIHGTLRTPQYRDYAQDINSSGTHLLKLINDILDLSKIEAGKFELAEEALDLRALAAEAVATVKERAKSAELELVNELPPDFPAVFADPRSLMQILLNLLSNAIKFTPKGGQVTVGAALDDNGAVHFRVSDTGKGIAKEDLAAVMEPFGQAGNAISGKPEGTGLGLPLSKKIVEMHGGSLTLKSWPGEGTTVEVTLPPERTLADNIEVVPKIREAG